MNIRTNRYDSTFVTYLRFDGKLDAITAYDGALRLALDTTFDGTGKGRTAKWMDDNYNPVNPSYQERIGESLNLAANLLADVIYSVSQTSQVTTTTTTAMTTSSPTSTTTTVVTTSYTSTPSSILTTRPTTTTPISTATSMVTTTMTSSAGASTVTTTTSYTQTSSTVLTTTTTSTQPPTTSTSYSTMTTATTQMSISSSTKSSASITETTSQTSSATSTSTTQAQRRRCIIATAAYGSELAPQVQALREIRDNQILATVAGSQFMRVFDRFYYSFSPRNASRVVYGEDHKIGCWDESMFMIMWHDRVPGIELKEEG